MKGRREEGKDSTADKLRRLLVNCPLCYGSGFPRHSYIQYASVRATADDTEQIQHFLGVVDKKDWERLRQFQGFHVRYDGLIAYALRCPSGLVAIVIIRDPFELWENDTLVSWKRVEGKSAASLVGLTDPSDWKPLETEALVR